ncbi:PEF-CTERM sorting domain-containing protein [Methanococcoides alaskense]|uniref:PEF-CTERM protein sorting domain-containing protein n=1 Tax=Methanococcoides alaskense TaxID=325778 RepID=A0AA90U0E8_9EURY|nr:PEF-CTERM sorting domain-containing protein [Methanococcoides alaskense]MDA0524393.1 PEF-CTERM sorting domain-containing protein [Methanococcoides alaskense]MDR6223210.1 hypothetical protein [Methanococcoides alaskense]
MAGMAGTAAAMPAEIDITPADIAIIPDGTTVKTATVLVYDIDYPLLGNHSRVITVQTDNPNLQARVVGNGVDTGWTNTARATSLTYTATATNTYPFTLELKGTEAGSITVYDNEGNVWSVDAGHDFASASDSVEVPEFPTIALPVAAIIGLAFFLQRRKEE